MIGSNLPWYHAVFDTFRFSLLSNFNHYSMKSIITYFLAFVMIVSALGHALMPDFYAPMIPDFVSKDFANYASVFFEGVIGVMLLIPKYRQWGGLAFMLLMIGFLPLHIWDMFKEVPAMGAPPAPLIRVLVQLVLIYAGFWVYKAHK